MTRFGWLVAAFVALLGLLVVSAAVSVQNARTVIEDETWVRHTWEVRKDTASLSEMIEESESAQRNYVITGHAVYLKRYLEIVDEIHRAVGQMAFQTRDNPVQQNNLKKLDQALALKFAEMNRVTAIRQSNGAPYAMARISEGAGRTLMQDVGGVLDAMDQEEDRLLQERVRNTNLSVARAATSFGIGTTLGIAFLVGVFVMVVRHTRALDQAREQEEAHRRSLEAEVKAKEEAQEAERRVLMELRRSNRELQDFAFVASHDLQEPLRKILAFGDRLSRKEREALSPAGADYLDRMLNAAERMQTLIHDLLAFSRVTTKAQPFVPTDLNKTLDRVMDDLQTRLEETNAVVEADPLPTIDADATQMAQLFQNLIANSLKFGRAGVQPVIRISANRESPNVWRIELSDNGIGFDPRHAEKIFTVFQRLHGRGEYEGSGIGLAICRKIVERHGGSIMATGKPDAGATFTFTLPTHPLQIDHS